MNFTSYLQDIEESQRLRRDSDCSDPDQEVEMQNHPDQTLNLGAPGENGNHVKSEHCDSFILSAVEPEDIPGLGQYDDFQTIDWQRDLARDRMRHRYIVKHKKDSFWDFIKSAHDAWSGWLCVFLVGLAAGNDKNRQVND